jgi:hypothetical protein
MPGHRASCLTQTTRISAGETAMDGTVATHQLATYRAQPRALILHDNRKSLYRSAFTHLVFVEASAHANRLHQHTSKGLS